MKAELLSYLTANHGNFQRITIPALINHFVGDVDNPGKWYGTIHARTLRRHLKEGDFKVVKPRQAPFLKPTHVAARLAWAQGLKKLKKRELTRLLKSYIFLDGTYFASKFEEGYGADDKHIVMPRGARIPTYTRFPTLPSNIQLYQGIALGGCTGPFIVNAHHPYEKGTIDAAIFRNFLRNYVAPLANQLRQKLKLAPKATIYLVMDHASAHKALKARALMKELNLESAGLPSRCPELNVIELLWAWYKRNLAAKEREGELKEKIIQMVNEWPQQQIDNLVKSFIARVQQMVGAGGEKFVYRNSKERARNK
jgi:transposase